MIGCGIGAFGERPVGICREVALAVGGNATIIGTDRRRRTTADLASFANGAAFRYVIGFISSASAVAVLRASGFQPVAKN
ncbi:MAG: hypothetical protein JOY90_33650 [Bradyrhizobium sp.]|nr:hypothetical protein [Bradyrhizobium sp.]